MRKPLEGELSPSPLAQDQESRGAEPYDAKRRGLDRQAHDGKGTKRSEMRDRSHRFPPPWIVEKTAPCFIVRDHTA